MLTHVSFSSDCANLILNRLVPTSKQYYKLTAISPACSTDYKHNINKIEQYVLTVAALYELSLAKSTSDTF